MSAKSKSLPENFLHVRTYEKPKQFADAFATGHLSLLGVFGSPGLGKSRFIRRALGDGVCWINGNASPFGIYMLAYEHRDRPIVIDDIDDVVVNILTQFLGDNSRFGISEDLRIGAAVWLAV